METQVTTKDLVLYYFDECPYCQKVLRKLREYKIDVELRNIRENREYYYQLRAINHGITQVPCLTIKGEPMLESDDIIYYLKEKFARR
jgi:glutaredoxin 3